MRKILSYFSVAVIGLWILIVVPLPIPAVAQVEAALGAAAAVIGFLTVDKIFERVDQAIDKASNAAESGGNRLLFNGADQMRQMLTQLSKELDSQRGKLFNDISDQRKLAIWDLYSVSLKLEEGVADDFAKGMVQLNNMIANVRFIGKDVKFLIVRVTPNVYQQNGVSGTPIKLFGVGIGTDQADKKISRTITIGGQRIADDKVSIKEWGVEVFLQKGDFDPLWKEDEYARAPMVVQSSITEPGSWICNWWGCTTTNTYTATYHVDLFPTKEAELNLLSRGEREVPEGSEAWDYAPITLPNMHNQGHLSTPETATNSMTAPPSWKYDGHDASRDACQGLSGNGCPFVRNQDCRVSTDRSQAICDANNDGHSCVFTFAVKRSKYKMEQVILPDQLVRMRPGDSKIIEVDAASKSAWIEGILATGEKFGPVSLIPPGGQALDPVSCTGGAAVGDRIQYTCVMREPV